MFFGTHFTLDSVFMTSLALAVNIVQSYWAGITSQSTGNEVDGWEREVLVNSETESSRGKGAKLLTDLYN